jgi:hypothetical protein
LQDAPQKFRIASPSSGFKDRLSHTARELDARKKPSNVAGLLAQFSLSLDPDAVAAVTLAYDTVLSELRLRHREDAGTLRGRHEMAPFDEKKRRSAWMVFRDAVMCCYLPADHLTTEQIDEVWELVRGAQTVNHLEDKEA